MSLENLSENAEKIACLLEQTGDFKVLRRIRMRDHFDSSVDQPVPVLIVDTETTGLNPQDSAMIEIGLLKVEVDSLTGKIGRVLDSYGGLEDPGFPIPPESTEIHGITDAMVKGQTFDEQRVADICQGVKLFVAHNAGFDKPFVLRRFPWLEESLWACSFRELPLKQEGYPSASLGQLIAQCGYFHEAHRAVEDCNALAHFLSHPLKETQRMPFEVLFESANQDIYEIVALNSPFETKDRLKSRGFRWNSDERVWEYTALGFSEGKEIIEFLRSQVYSTEGKIRLGFRIRSGKDRYSGLAVPLKVKEV